MSSKRPGHHLHCLECTLKAERSRKYKIRQSLFLSGITVLWSTAVLRMAQITEQEEQGGEEHERRATLLYLFLDFHRKCQSPHPKGVCLTIYIIKTTKQISSFSE